MSLSTTDADLMTAKKILNRFLADNVLRAFVQDSLRDMSAEDIKALLRQKGEGPRPDGWMVGLHDVARVYFTIEAVRAHLERAMGDETRPDDQIHLEVDVPYYLGTEEVDWR